MRGWGGFGHAEEPATRIMLYGRVRKDRVTIALQRNIGLQVNGVISEIRWNERLLYHWAFAAQRHGWSRSVTQSSSFCHSVVSGRSVWRVHKERCDSIPRLSLRMLAAGA